MSIDIERELRLAMQDHTDDIVAPPDFLVRLHRRRSRTLPRLAIATAAVAAAATVAGVVVVGEHVGGQGADRVNALSTYHPATGTPQRAHQAVQEMNDAISNWGRPRGDKGGDASVQAQLKAEWEHPGSHPVNLGSFEPVQSPSGPMRVLWAATTPDGLAALAVQPTHDPVADYWYGIFLPDASHQPRLAQRGQLDAGVDLGEFDPHLISFTLSSRHDAVVVVPTDAGDTVRISFRAKPDGTGHLVPQWQGVAVNDGAAIAAVPPGGDVWGTVAEVSRGGQVVADHRLDFIATHLLNEGPSQPANVLGLWCNGCGLNAGASPGYGLAMLDAWLVRHGPLYLPVYVSEWSLGARLRDGNNVFAVQLWVPGDQAHTVVLVDRPAARAVDVLEDEVTVASARPLVALRLPEQTGWMVGAGPNAVVTGWRPVGGSWHDVAGKKALLVPTDAGAIQLRMVVKGKEQVVTRYSRGS